MSTDISWWCDNFNNFFFSKQEYICDCGWPSNLIDVILFIFDQASKKLLPRGKVPIMCVLIDQISTQNEEASAMLRDPSGQHYSHIITPDTFRVADTVHVWSVVDVDEVSLNWWCIWYYLLILMLYTVKPVFKGHCDEGTTCDQGTLSQNRVLSSPC